jgi:hypothetical protein
LIASDSIDTSHRTDRTLGGRAACLDFAKRRRVLGRRNVSQRKRPSLHATTRRSRTTALPSHGSLRRGPGRRNVSQRKRPPPHAITRRSRTTALPVTGRDGGRATSVPRLREAKAGPRSPECSVSARSFTMQNDPEGLSPDRPDMFQSIELNRGPRCELKPRPPHRPVRIRPPAKPSPQTRDALNAA